MAEGAEKSYIPHLAESIALGVRTRRRVIELTDEINARVTRTTVPEREFVPGMPTINVPEMLEKRSFIRQRLFNFMFESRPYVTFVQKKGADSATGIDWHVVTRELTDFFDYEADAVLRIPECMRYVLIEFVDYGLGVWKVVQTQSREGVRLPRWDFVSVRDLLWPDGLGVDIQSFPWFGQVYRLQPGELRARARSGVYDPDVVSRIETEDTSPDDNAIALAWNDALLDSTLGDVPTVDVAELWYRHPETLEERLADVHLASGLVLRDVEAPHARPYFAARFDERSALSFFGLGVGDKLAAIQDITNAVYNIAIAAGVVSTQQVRLVRQGSTLAKLLYGDDETLEIGPNFQGVTEDPQTDLAIVPLGLPQGAAGAINLLEPVKQYAARMFGAMDAQMGSVGTTRRAPAYGVASVLEEGSMPLRDLLRRLAVPIYEAVYHTLDLYTENPERVQAVCGDDGAEVVRALSQPGSVRTSLRVSIKVADPTTVREQKQQRALLETQLMMQWSQQLAQMAMLIGNPQLLPAVREALVQVAEKVEELTRRFLDATGDVQDLDAVVVNVREALEPIVQQGNQMFAMMMQQGPQNPNQEQA